MQRIRPTLLTVLALALFSAGCATPTPPTAVAGVTKIPDQSATVGEFAGQVSGRASAEGPLEPVRLGFLLKSGGQVQTAESSRARLDFSDGSIVRLAPNASFTLQSVETTADGQTLTHLQLAFGKVWVSLAGGEIQVETPVGVASVRGSFAILQYDTNNQLLRLDCLEGSCTARNAQGVQQLGNLERLVISPTGSLKGKLTAQDVQQFVQDNPESGGLVATLTAAPPATETPTPASTTTSTATPAVTPIGTETAPSTSTASTTAVPGATLAPTLNARILGAHVVRSGETLSCIGRAYGVVPAAIASANGGGAVITIGQALRIPAVQWVNIPGGPICPAQFVSPFPGLATVTATATPSMTTTTTATTSATPTASATPTRTATLPSRTPTATITTTLTPTLTPTATRPPTDTPTPTATLPPTDTPTLTATLPPTDTETPTPTLTLTPDPNQDFGWKVGNVQLNGGGNTVTASPGQPVRVQLDYQAWNAASCPSCIAQIVIGVDAGARYCAYDGIPGPYPGAGGASTNTINAPEIAGTYTLTAGFDLQFGCGDALKRFGGGAVIGAIVVP